MGFLSRNRRHRLWKKVVSVLACVVVFCTTYALILPAITLETDPVFCGLEVHQHDEKCYENVLICGHKETEAAVHVHSPECYTQQQELVCEEAEDLSIVHAHTDGCTTTEQQLICESTDPEHQHTDECYKTDTFYICGLEEGKPEGHVHTAACYETKDVLICGLEEETTPTHTHSEECYESKLVCVKEEHSHTLGCYSNPEADKEQMEDWVHSMTGVERTGRWHTDLVAVAESQIGYQESDQNYMVSEAELKKGYTRYGDWYGSPYEDWCAMFVSFCLNYAGIPEEAFPREASCPGWVKKLQSETCGLYREPQAYTPKAGDLIFFDWDGDLSADHVGVIAELLAATETESASIRTIEGNSDNCVQEKVYEMNEAAILGFGELPVEPRIEYHWNQNGMDVKVSILQDTNMPQNAQLMVQPLSMEEVSDTYETAYLAFRDQILAENGATVSYFNLYKVYFDVDGTEYIPQGDADIDVTVSSKEYPLASHTTLFHTSENGGDALEMTAAEDSRVGVFETSLSTVYGIVGSTEPVSDTLAEAAPHAEITAPINLHKTIDAFRDEVDNPDTNLDNQDIRQDDLYRLYLDAQVGEVSNPIDLLIVVDQSGSMHDDYHTTDGRDMTKEDGEKAYRDEALRLVLNGTSSTDLAVYEANKQNGLIYQFLNANEDNRVAVVGFQGHGCDDNYNYFYGPSYKFKMDASGKLADVKTARIQVSGGYETRTYTSGIVDADNYFEAETILGWTKEAQFVDVEGYYYNATNYTAGFTQAQRELDRAKADNNHQKIVLFLSDGVPTCYIAGAEGSYYRGGNGSEEEADGTGSVTTAAFKKFMDDNSGITLHTLSIYGGTAAQRLQDMAAGGSGRSFSVTTTNELKANLKKLMFGTSYTNLKIEDTLSEYVDLYTSQPDYKVTRKESDGTITTLYENGAITSDGQGVIQSVGYRGYDPKTVYVQFDPDYTPMADSIITLSFNIKTRPSAYEEYEANGYPHIGDAATDYRDNSTSSGQQGFRSNTEAKLTYQSGDSVFTGTYPHPVVQVSDNPPPDEPDPPLDQSVENHKKIDAFRDGTDNTDTDLDNQEIDKTDLYRLYLDAAIKEERNPIDLLIVVDESESMTTSDMPSGSTQITRVQAINNILNGTGGNDKGIISDFLNMTEGNKVAVVGFYGANPGRNYSYETDASILHDWGSDAATYGTVRVAPPSGGYLRLQRTNYCAGLRMAEDLLNSDAVKGDGHKKMIIFLSDGVPTFYLTNKDGGREGTGVDEYWGQPQTDNINACVEGTKTYFTNFFKDSNPGVPIHTVGIFPGADASRVTDTRALQFLASETGGSFVNASSTEAIENALRQFINRSDVSDLLIEDNLSEYVDVYSAKPDFKLTMNDAAGNSTVLWDANGVTAEGENIVKSVGSVGKQVRAVFMSTYRPQIGTTFTLSFNVQTTQDAYDAYARDEGVYLKTGDPNTDYGTNTTSSNQPGFRSNASASVSYRVDGVDKSLPYPHPVVQAASCDIVLKKVDSVDTTKVLSGASFALYRNALEGETGVPLNGTGEYVLIREHCTTDEYGQVVITDLVPGNYWLVETTVPDGYERPSEPIPFTLGRKAEDGSWEIVGSSETATIDGKTLPQLQVTNTPGSHVLPNTGGIGTQPYTTGGLLILFASATLLYNKKKRGKEDESAS